MRFYMAIFLTTILGLSGCLSAFHREDRDFYRGASTSWEGNGRDTTMNVRPANPTQPVAQPTLRQIEPPIGKVFVLFVRGKKYEAVKKADGKVYIIREIK